MEPSHDTAAGRRGFFDKLRRMRNKRYEEWTHIVFGGPVGTLLAAVVGDVGWITPNLLTLIALLARLGAAVMLCGRDPALDLAAAMLVLTAIPVDIMDGSLARYRGLASRFGSFFDKVSDAIAIVGFGFCLAYRSWLETGDIRLVLIAVFIPMGLVFRRYLWWLRNYMRLEAGKAPAGARDPGLSELGFGQRMRYYAGQTWRLVLVMESDVYVAVCVGLLAGALAPVLWVVGACLAVWLAIIIVARFIEMYRLDRA